MSKSSICILVSVVSLIFLPGQTNGQGITGIPDLSNSYASIAYTGPGVPSLLVVPDGTGNPFTAAHDEQGNEVDATITLYVLDGLNFPIVNFPFEDLWLESADGGMVPCISGTIADQHTDVQGMTMWVNPLLAAGHSQAPVHVFINGSAITSNAGLPLNINSPDINGDGNVNLTDISILSSDYYTSYNFRCDMNGDGFLNLADVPFFARHYGATCP